MSHSTTTAVLKSYLDLRAGDIPLGGARDVQSNLLNADEVLAGWDVTWNGGRQLSGIVVRECEGVEGCAPLGNLNSVFNYCSAAHVNSVRP